MDQDVKEFFLHYESANSLSEVSAIGGLYADTFMFGGPEGVQAVKKEDFLRVVPKMKAHFCSIGVSETRLLTVDARPLDSNFLLTRVAWRVTVRHSPNTRHVDAFTTYVLTRGRFGELSIVFQIDHQDLAAAIKDIEQAAQ